MFNFNFNKGVLGLNARNLIYIRELNSREQINFADSKLKTKHYLSARNIPVPKLYAAIKTHDDLFKFDFGSLPGSVVLKPNRGSGGDGIIAFKDRKGDNFFTVSGKTLNVNEIKSHIIDIIDGRFSITNTRDIAFFEQRIQTHKALEQYTHQGLPDIRIIVYNLIPVMAMLRLPTIESDGKANMALGALGIGLDMATGKPTHIARKFELIDEIPGKGKFAPDFRIPFWDDILLIASKCQQISNLGYLACDIALDENFGPILLELNARAGLKVQIANKAGLKKRLDQIKDIKVSTPEKGIRLAKDMFSKKQNNQTKASIKPIINLEEDVYIVSNEEHSLRALIDPKKDKAEISQNTVDKLNLKLTEKNNLKLKISLKNNKILTVFKLNKKLTKYDIVLGNKEVQGYLINPVYKKQSIQKIELKSANPKDFYIQNQIDYGKVDYQINEVSKSIKLISRLIPINLKTELEKYHKDNLYNPQFKYNVHSELLYNGYKQLSEINTDNSPLGTIFQKKKNELFNQLKLIEYIGTDDFNHYSQILFPYTNKAELELAKKYLPNNKYYKQENKGKLFTAKETKKIFEEVLAKYNLSHWEVVLKEKMISDCSVGKSNKMYIKSKARFYEHRINKLIAHEIETHVLTNENGKKQPYAIFQNGLANYLQTQEGLAIYNQELALHIYPHNCFASDSYVYTHVSLNHSFSEAVEILRRDGIERNSAITSVLKTKRGLADTSKKGGFAKHTSYFRGALKIDKFIKQGGKLEELYIGKIDIDDLEILKQIKSINRATILPVWY